MLSNQPCFSGFGDVRISLSHFRTKRWSGLQLDFLVICLSYFPIVSKSGFHLFPYALKTLKHKYMGISLFTLGFCWGFSSYSLICEQKLKRLKKGGKLVQYFRYNEIFLLSVYFPAVLICGYSPFLGDPQGTPNLTLYNLTHELKHLF